MTIAQLINQVQTNNPIDLYKSRQNILEKMNQVYRDIIEGGKLIVEDISATLSATTSSVDLSGDSVLKVVDVLMYDSSADVWTSIPQAKTVVSAYAGDTYSPWYWQQVDENLVFNKTASDDVSLKIRKVSSYTALTDGTGLPELNIGSAILEGTRLLLNNHPDYDDWLALIIRKVRDRNTGTVQLKRQNSFF